MGKYRKHLSLAKMFAKRILRLRRNLKLFLAAVLLINAALVLQLYINTHVYPNTYLGSQNISGKTPSEIDALAVRYLHIPYSLRVQNRTYTYTYADLGVSIDEHMLRKLIFARNRKWFPVNVLFLLRSYVTTTQITAPLVMTQGFSRFIQDSVFDFSVGKDAVIFDGSENSLTYIENEEKYRFDEPYLVTLLKSRVGDNSTPLYPKLVKVTNVKEQMIADTGERIKQIYLEPVTVIIDTGAGMKSFILTERELSDLAKITLTPDQTDVVITLNTPLVIQMFDSHVKSVGLIAQSTIATPKVQADLKDILTARFNGHSVDALTIAFDKGPNTNGSIAEKYIEVDISQQKMYIFKDNALVSDYRVSTGKDYPTPTGEFKILNKTGLGYSSIYNVWMPWWMGFAYSDTLHAFFGIHELPYALVGGDKIQRPSSFIGAPNTGGCIALDVGAAQKVYQFADIGTPVLVYP